MELFETSEPCLRVNSFNVEGTIELGVNDSQAIVELLQGETWV